MVQKKEMTKMRVDGKFIPVTLVKIVPQEIVRYKTEEVDGYESVIVWVEKKSSKKEKGQKFSYKMMTEFTIDDEFVKKYKTGTIIDESILDGVESVSVIGTAKGKGFQWVMKRFHTKWWPKTHGSKFHRQVWSLGNRKPRRVQKWHPHAGRMWGQRVTLTEIPLIEVVGGEEKLFVLKGSLPGAYNGLLKIVLV